MEPQRCGLWLAMACCSAPDGIASHPVSSIVLACVGRLQLTVLGMRQCQPVQCTGGNLACAPELYSLPAQCFVQALFKLGESQCESLADTSDEVSLKLALWTGSSEFEELSGGWCGTLFESLDVAAVEEAINRCVTL